MLASLPLVGSEKRLIRETKKAKAVAWTHWFGTKPSAYFRWHLQFHTAETLLAQMAFLDPEERVLFNVDVRKLDQDRHAELNMYGVGRFFFGLDLLAPDDNVQQILPLNSMERGDDLKFAMKAKFQKQDLASFTSAVVNGQKF